ncbi:MAG: anti-sigma factor antagonist [Candidatus Latescibacteria bacterium]|nr:anti-sigma factor antagonist [Candidatus Latescibacterota bacterium]
MSLDIEKRDEIFLLTPRKDLSGGDETRELEKAIQEIIAKGKPQIVVDLGRVSYINSAGLGSLVAAHTSCKNREGWLRLARTGKRIKNLFLITKLAFVFETYDSVDDALVGIDRG